jgi:hypothetical protein
VRWPENPSSQISLPNRPSALRLVSGPGEVAGLGNSAPSLTSHSVRSEIYEAAQACEWQVSYRVFEVLITPRETRSEASLTS